MLLSSDEHLQARPQHRGDTRVPTRAEAYTRRADFSRIEMSKNSPWHGQNLVESLNR